MSDSAYAHYNSHYNNASYHAVQVALVRDVCGAYQASETKLLEIALRIEPIHSLLNLLTDVCLEVSGHPDRQGQRERLMGALADAQVSAETVRLMSQHIEQFEAQGSLFSADFENTALALLQMERIDLYTAKSQTASVHGRAGNIAHDLLIAAESLLQVAKLVLKGEPSQAYIGEKLRQAERHLGYAKTDMDKPAPAPLAPCKTLLLSGDESYVGMLTAVDANGVRVTWYKWGFGSADVIEDWLPLEQVNRTLSADECTKRFGGLPEGYGKD